MNPLVIISPLLIAAIGAGARILRPRAQKLAEQRTREERERLAADEMAVAEAKAREDARLQAEAEERTRKEAEAKQRAEETALADAEEREAARMKAEAENRERAEAEAREKPLASLDANHYRSIYATDLPGSLRVEEHTAQLDKDKAREFQRDFKAGKIHVLSCSTTFELGVDLGNLDTVFLRNVPPESFNHAQRAGRTGRRSGYPGFVITYCKRGPHDLYHFAQPTRMLSGQIRPPVLNLKNAKVIARHVAAVGFSAFFRTSPERFKNVQTLLRDLANPSGVADFKTFLQHRRVELEKIVLGIVPPEMWEQVGLKSGEWIEHVTGVIAHSFDSATHAEESRFLLAEQEISSDFRNILCEGKRGRGFHVCRECGAGFQRNPPHHSTPFGRPCQGQVEGDISLGHESVTDVLQLQFLPHVEPSVDKMWLAFSLSYALVEGAAEVLDVPSNDLNTTVSHAAGVSLPPLILYDSVAGGAGLVAQLENENLLKRGLEAALNRVGGACGCDEETSCYGCLRGYRNQFAHQNLRRGQAKKYLEALFATWT